MKIAAWKEESFIDYPEKISTIIFTPKCNYNCGYCHNPELKSSSGNVDEKKIFDYLKSKRGWIDAVVISGGEPTLEFGLENFCEEVKNMGYLVKLDTNGKNFKVLQELKRKNLVDYVAMDVKGPLELYPNIVGKNFIDERDDVGKGISIVSNFLDYEFRTTVVPIYENEKLRWITPEEIGETAKLIYDYTGTKEHKYFLQSFRAIEKKNADKKFSKENLPKEMWETPKGHLEKCLVEAIKYLPNTMVRGQ